MSTLRITLLITVILPLYYELCSCRCAPAEYEIEEQCCPMCAPGNRVYWHCTEDTSTTCVPCPESTYIDEPSGLSQCLTCTECDLKRGLRVSKACTRSSDAVCEPLDRFFCIERDKHTCRLAVQHSECRPGQYIRQAGTGSTDTVCADCTADTYSNGSLSSCKPHTKCEDLGLTEINPGTQSSDSECGNLHNVTAIAVSVTATVILIITVISVLTIRHFQKKKRSHRSGKEEMGNLNEKARMAVHDLKNTDQFGLEQPVKLLFPDNSELSPHQDRCHAIAHTSEQMQTIPPLAEIVASLSFAQRQ